MWQHSRNLLLNPDARKTVIDLTNIVESDSTESNAERLTPEESDVEKPNTEVSNSGKLDSKASSREISNSDELSSDEFSCSEKARLGASTPRSRSSSPNRPNPVVDQTTFDEESNPNGRSSIPVRQAPVLRLTNRKPLGSQNQFVTYTPADFQEKYFPSNPSTIKDKPKDKPLKTSPQKAAVPVDHLTDEEQLQMAIEQSLRSLQKDKEPAPNVPKEKPQPQKRPRIDDLEEEAQLALAIQNSLQQSSQLAPSPPPRKPQHMSKTSWNKTTNAEGDILMAPSLDSLDSEDYTEFYTCPQILAKQPFDIRYWAHPAYSDYTGEIFIVRHPSNTAFVCSEMKESADTVHGIKPDPFTMPSGDVVVCFIGNFFGEESNSGHEHVCGFFEWSLYRHRECWTACEKDYFVDVMGATKNGEIMMKLDRMNKVGIDGITFDIVWKEADRFFRLMD
ncbi:hypothetical protein GQ43DRAFT_136570 [Delitschia confertaspora ATCC 74209]|uniref:Uncharacterized protein n=1 Tax=Delitschia confertaspora ATCC 74209 TaxID=1513339 RepID=A0A9P4MW24_9PLEO|nr:hypothetical protein GQ43DRAFT_136570 [Delitschia confertaspora ATCC 74209]